MVVIAQSIFLVSEPFAYAVTIGAIFLNSAKLFIAFCVVVIAQSLFFVSEPFAYAVTIGARILNCAKLSHCFFSTDPFSKSDV